MPDTLLTLSEKDVQKWFRDIELSLKWREPFANTWHRNIDYLKGKYFSPSAIAEEDRIAVNMVHPHVRVVIPAIYARDPDIMVKVQQEDPSLELLYEKRAEIILRDLRYQIKRMGLKNEVKLCILDAVCMAHAWIKTGYETEFEEVESRPKQKKKASKGIASTMIDEVLSALGIKGPEEEDYSEEEYEDDDQFYCNTKILSEDPWALRVSPFDIAVPMLSRRPEELYWIGERVILPTQRVKDNPDWDTQGLKPSANANQLLAKLRNASYTPVASAENSEYNILWEIYDKDSRNIILLSEGHPRPLQIKGMPYTYLETKWHPYRMLRWNEIPDQFYPMSDIEAADAQLNELNETRTQMSRHRKRYNRRYLSKPSALDPQAKADMKLGEDGTVIEVSTTYQDEPLEETLVPLVDAPLPPEVYAVEKSVRNDILNILGTNDYSGGASGPARSATEASIVATQSRFRVEERIDTIGEFIQGILTNVAMMEQYYKTKDQMMDILGADAIYWKQERDTNKLSHQYLYEIDYGSTTPVNEAVANEQYMKFYAMVSQDPMFNQIKARLELVRRFDLPEPETWLNQQLAEILQQTLTKMIQSGQLPPGFMGSKDASGSLGEPGRVPDPSKLGGASLRDSQALGGMSTPAPSVPGGLGGTADKVSLGT